MQAAPLFPLEHPGIVSIPAGFVFAVLGTLVGACHRSEGTEQDFGETQFCAYTGAGTDGTVAAHD